jgi:hypothetical protein
MPSLVNILFICSNDILDSLSFTVSTRRILHIVNSDNENDEGVDEQPTQIHHDTEEDEDEEDDATDKEEDAGEDDGLQHLPASQVGATLQQEVKIP